MRYNVNEVIGLSGGQELQSFEIEKIIDTCAGQYEHARFTRLGCFFLNFIDLTE